MSDTTTTCRIDEIHDRGDAMAEALRRYRHWMDAGCGEDCEVEDGGFDGIAHGRLSLTNRARGPRISEFPGRPSDVRLNLRALRRSSPIAEAAWEGTPRSPPTWRAIAAFGVADQAPRRRRRLTATAVRRSPRLVARPKAPDPRPGPFPGQPPRFMVSRAMITCWIWLVPS